MLYAEESSRADTIWYDHAVHMGGPRSALTLGGLADFKGVDVKQSSYFVNCSRCRGFKRHYGRGLCANCTRLLKQQGLPLPPKAKRSFEEWASLVDTSVEGCWPWPGPITPYGYGSASGPDRRQPAHVMYYERALGPVPDGMTLDHVCHNDTDCTGGVTCLHRRCVRPSHLDAVPMGVNLVRSHVTFSGVNARKTHCVEGPPLAGDNLVVIPSSAGRGDQRACRTCRRASGKRSMQLVRASSRNAAIRRWAGQSGYVVSRYGHIPRAVVAAYDSDATVANDVP